MNVLSAEDTNKNPDGQKDSNSFLEKFVKSDTQQMSEVQRALKTVGIDLDFVFKKLKVIMDNPKKEENVIRAATEILKTMGAYAPEKIKVEKTPFDDLTDDQLKNYVTEIFKRITENPGS